jgi:hypothetical protein
MPARLAQQDDENGLMEGRLGKLSKPRRGEGTPPPSTLFSEEIQMLHLVRSIQSGYIDVANAERDSPFL